MSTNVYDLVIGGPDAVGVTIEAIYGRKPPEYAVYRTRERVLIHYADETDRASEQRHAMARLNPVRGEINGLIDRWRYKSPESGLRFKADRYDRRVGDALIVAFEDDIPGAEALLDAIKQDILHERTAWARFEYLGYAFVTAMVFALAAGASVNWAIDGGVGGAQGDLLRAAGAGAFGAFFSIALAIRSRTVLPDLQRLGNIVDAVLRVVIGCIAGAVLVAMLHSQAVTLEFGNAGLTKANPWLFVLLAGFVAGFSERMVPDLLSKVGASMAPVQDTARRSTQTPAASPRKEAAAPVANRTDDKPATAEEPHPEDGLDCCGVDHEFDPEDLTFDEQLPPASGGVALKTDD